MASSPSPSKIAVRAVAVALAAALVWSACGRDQGNLTAPVGRVPSLAFSGAQQGLGPAIAAQARYTDRLLTNPGVVGTGVGLTRDGRPAVKIFTKAAGVAGLPASLDGIPVVVQVTGEIVALSVRPSRPSGGAASLTPGTTEYAHPVPIGVSTGNVTATSNCATGTISARLLTATASYYALSNNHVYALENKAPIGSQVVQPGLIDDDCPAGGISDPDGPNDPGDVIGTLAYFKPIVFKRTANNVIDAAIALSSTTDLGDATPPDGYGVPSSTTTAAFVGQLVEKYGRTTLLTTGSVSAVNSTVLVSYGNGKTARFIDQIFVQSSTTSAFIGAGDSGSLLVTDNSTLTNQEPIGLLFAGNSSGSMAVANPIDSVLAYFSSSSAVGATVTIDGK